MAVFYTIVETKVLSHTFSLHLIPFSLSHTCCICLGRTSVVVIERSWSGSQNCDCVQEGGFCSVFLSTYQVSFKQVCEGGGALQMVNIYVWSYMYMDLIPDLHTWSQIHEDFSLPLVHGWVFETEKTWTWWSKAIVNMFRLFGGNLAWGIQVVCWETVTVSWICIHKVVNPGQ